jgi:hypothetical protein
MFRRSAKVQVKAIQLSGRLHDIAPIPAGFAVCCSHMSRLAGRSAAGRFWTSGSG